MNRTASASRPPFHGVPDGAFTARFRIRFAHCDPAGIVYYPRYFDMFNTVVEDWFYDRLAISYAGLIMERGIGIPTMRAECTYERPSRIGEMMNMTPLLNRIGTSSFDFTMTGHVEGERRLEGRLVLVTTDMQAGRPIPIPPDLLAALHDYEAACGERP